MIAKQRKIVVLFAGWTFTLLALLAVYKSIPYDLFFSLAFIGLLILIGLSGPFTVKPAWRSRIDLIIVAGAVIFLIIVAWKIYAIDQQYTIVHRI